MTKPVIPGAGPGWGVGGASMRSELIPTPTRRLVPDLETHGKPKILWERKAGVGWPSWKAQTWVLLSQKWFPWQNLPPSNPPPKGLLLESMAVLWAEKNGMFLPLCLSLSHTHKCTHTHTHTHTHTIFENVKSKGKLSLCTIWLVL